MGSDSPSLAADYAVLEVPWSASADEIQSAYRQMLMVWHPDRFPGDPSLRRRAEEKTKSITVAYSRIRHAPLRNASLTPRAAPTPPPSQAVHRSEPGPPPPKPRRVEPRPGRQWEFRIDNADDLRRHRTNLEDALRRHPLTAPGVWFVDLFRRKR